MTVDELKEILSDVATVEATVVVNWGGELRDITDFRVSESRMLDDNMHFEIIPGNVHR